MNSNDSSCSCRQDGHSAVSSCGCTSGEEQAQQIRVTTGTISFSNRLDHILARWGVDRTGHRVEPGLYRLGNPTPDSPVFASANYTLSFDVLRSALSGTDSYLLVLDTKGINVWCAAGKGTFGTDELVHRIEASGLASVVRHHKVIVPQLGAPGITAHEVARRSGFSVEYGPVRAHDLPEYLVTRTATPAMRRVTFPLAARLVLAPMEIVHVAVPTIVAAILLYLLAGPIAALAAVTAVIGGTVLFPAFLPYIPTHDFSTKGLLLGGILAVPFAGFFATNTAVLPWEAPLAVIIPILIMPAVTAYLALNFTGSTTFTSRTGVKKEIFRYIPVMAVMAGLGTALGILMGIFRFMGAT